jgi:hypothetical protein
VKYGRCKAKIMRRDDGSPFVHSLAHGTSTVYRLCYDAPAVLAKMQGAAKDKRLSVFLDYGPHAELEPADIEMLVSELAKDKLTTKAQAKKLLREAKAKLWGKRLQQKKEQELAERRDPRPRLPCPLSDAEWRPVMAQIDEVLAASKDVMPPMRDSDGNLVTARMRRIAKMHTFVTANESDKDHKPLPPPDTLLLTTLGLPEAAELIERHIEYVNKGRSVHLPNEFVVHYMRRDVSKLPLITAVSTMPVVCADGTIYGHKTGLDRDRATFFNVQPELVAIIPRRDACNNEAVRGAMKFLMEEWLVDVAGDYAAKCVVLSELLALLERLELEDRPLYNHTAAIPASGKTTLLKMISLAVFGTPPPAAPWSFNLEERRKALFSFLVEGAGCILWDNIPAGSSLWCPHVERSCTTRIYADRPLGHTKTIVASSAVIHQTTGNNIMLLGDLATRGLEVRLDTDRPDPQNRKFKHNAPLAWTMQDRARILKALYTLLLGNPMLKRPLDTAVPTRFKDWMRLCGSAVEHGAAIHLGSERSAVANGVVFDDMFKKQVEESATTTSLVEMMGALLTYIEDNQRRANTKDDQSVAELKARGDLPLDALSAGEIAAKLNEPLSYDRVDDVTLREFLFKDVNFNFTKVSPKQVSAQLRKHRDAVVWAGDGSTLTLKRSDTRYNGNTEYLWRVVRRTKDGKVEPRMPPPPPPEVELPF